MNSRWPLARRASPAADWHPDAEPRRRALLLVSSPSLTVRWSSPSSAGELFSLLHFAAPSLFDDAGGFVTWLGRHLAPGHPGSPETVRDRPRVGSRRASRRAATARPRRNGFGGR